MSNANLGIFIRFFQISPTDRKQNSQIFDTKIHVRDHNRGISIIETINFGSNSFDRKDLIYSSQYIPVTSPSIWSYQSIL